MKKYFLAIFFTLTILHLEAQDSLFAGKVNFKFIKPSIEGNVWKPKSYNSELQFNSSESIFFYNKFAMLNGEKEETVLTPQGFGIRALDADIEGYQFYRNFNNEEIFIRIPQKKPLEPVSIEDNWLEINWKIKKGERKILGYSCQRAIGEFRGRIYEVWFTKEILISSGPWKLFGLPGLILEAKDSKNQIKFIATDVCYPCESDVEIKKRLESKHMTIQEYSKYNDYLMENVESKLKTKLDSLKSINKIDSSIEINLDNKTTKKEVRNKRSYMLEIIYEWEKEAKKKFKN